MPTTTGTAPNPKTYDWAGLIKLSESGRRIEDVEYARQAALRERLEDVLVRLRALDTEIEEILDDAWLAGGT